MARPWTPSGCMWATPPRATPPRRGSRSSRERLPGRRLPGGSRPALVHHPRAPAVRAGLGRRPDVGAGGRRPRGPVAGHRPVPTRPGARAPAAALVTPPGGGAVLPPQMRPLGDLDEGEPPFEPGDLALDLPAAIDPLARRFELTRLVASLADRLPERELTAASA